MANRTPAFPSSYQARSTRSHVTPSPAPRLLLLSLPCLGPHDAFDLNSVPAFSQLGAAIPPPLATFGLSVLPALPVHPLPAGSPHTPRPRFFLGPLRSWSPACQEIMLPVWPLAPSSPHKASLSRSTYNGPLSSSCFHFTIYNPPRFSYSSCTMAAQIYNPDHTMSAAEEEALGASGDDLAVDNLPEGMFHHLADPADLLAAKKPCMAPALPASLFASPTPGGAPRSLRRTCTDAAAPLPPPLRRRVVVNVLLSEAGLESYRSEIFAGINAQLCGFIFSYGIIPSIEQTIGDPYRVARRVYGRLLFSWPSQDDAAAFRKLFPFTLKVSNSRPFLLKVFEDRFEAFTAAKAAGAPTLSIRNVPLDFDLEDICTYLLSPTESDGSRWLADLMDFHRALDPYEDTYFTHLAGLPIATLDDPNFERIPSEIPLEDNKPPMLLNFYCHVCSLCANNHRACDHEAFAAHRRQRLTNRNVISAAQLQKANATLLDNLSQLFYLTFFLPYRSGPLVLPFLLSISTSPPPCYTTSPLFQSYSSHPPCSVPLLPHPPLPSQLCYLTFSSPYRSGPPLSPPPLWLGLYPTLLPFWLLPLFLNALPHARNILGNHAAPTTFRNDPGLIYIGLDDKVETWTCALCDFTYGAALDSAMVHI
ncbi:unnamed protein product [Closterium sp. NIES-54]